MYNVPEKSWNKNTYIYIQYILEYLHNHTWKALMSSVNRGWVRLLDIICFRWKQVLMRQQNKALENNCSHDWK